MLIKAQKEITRISDNEEINSINYMDSLNYISNLYLFINKFKTVISTSDVVFLPSFYGQNACETLHKEVYGKESEMKVLRLESSLFLVDKTVEKVKKVLTPICEEITHNNNQMTFILK